MNSRDLKVLFVYVLSPYSFLCSYLPILVQGLIKIVRARPSGIGGSAINNHDVLTSRDY
jgi:hypothetical protein